MFTDQAQLLLNQAKRDALTLGSEELTLESLLAATAQQAEGGVLLARCLGLAVEQLREQRRTLPSEGTL